MAQVNLPPGFELVEEPQAATLSTLPDGFVIGGEDAPVDPSSSGAASALVGAARVAPTAGRILARTAANHPAATQRLMNATVRGAAATVGAHFGGTPGAIAGATFGGVVPKQSTIREVAGRLAGEAPDVAATAGRALGLQNYAQHTYGIDVDPEYILERPAELGKAITNYAQKGGRDVLQLFGPDNKVVVGPTAPEATAPSRLANAAGKVTTGGRLIARTLQKLAPLQGAVAMTDLAQTAEPNRQDIGVIGMSLHPEPAPPAPDELRQINDRNIAAMNSRQRTQADQRTQVRAKILALLGMR